MDRIKQNINIMDQELWLNLPVKDLEKSQAFFTSLGFESTRDSPGMIGFVIGKVPVMMVEESQLEQYTENKISDTSKGSEFLISVSAPDRAYVDQITEKRKTRRCSAKPSQAGLVYDAATGEALSSSKF